MIRGENLDLRAIEPEDTERCHRWINDPEVTRTLGMRYPLTLAAERRWVEQERDATREIQLIIMTLDGQPIGTCGLMGMTPIDRSAELGILIGEKGYWGKGYGTDAVLTLCAFGFTQLNLHRIALGVFPFNTRGIACYEKCGFQDEGADRQAIYRHGEYHDILRMGILAEEYREKWPIRWTKIPRSALPNGTPEEPQ
jgi:RimJ/RimL family protein N-acetyltransferase